MRLISKQLLSKVSLEQLNSHMQSVNFSYHALSSKPPVIATFDNEKLSFEAAEMWCLVRYLAIAVDL